MTLDAGLCGVAGEYFVAAELSRRGCLASITLRNSRGVDILACRSDGTNPIAIQVKTNQRGVAEWILNQKVEAGTEATSDEKFFFVLVNLPPDGAPPTYYIISRPELARLSREGHQSWLATPGRGGKPHSPNNSIRKFKDVEGKYLGRWDLLGLG
jgi:hypothetical protein